MPAFALFAEKILPGLTLRDSALGQHLTKYERGKKSEVDLSLLRPGDEVSVRADGESKHNALWELLPKRSKERIIFKQISLGLLKRQDTYPHLPWLGLNKAREKEEGKNSNERNQLLHLSQVLA